MRDPRWTDHPRLTAWLREQAEAFPQWASAHPGGWDYSLESIDRLQAVIKAEFSSWDDVRARQRTPAVTVPAWYLGEVCVRAGAVWKHNPQAPSDSWDGPFVGVRDDPIEDPDHEDTEEDGWFPAAVPVHELRDMFEKRPEWRLRSVVEAFLQYPDPPA